MTQEIEIEFKNLLTKSEFLKLGEALCMKEHDFKQQVNHYFDTKDFSLKQKISTPHPRKRRLVRSDFKRTCRGRSAGNAPTACGGTGS